MSLRQDLRDKIHRKNGKPFKMSDVANAQNRDYFNLRDLVAIGELTCEGIGNNAVYQATPNLKIRKAAKNKKQVDLQGWREVFPGMFKHVKIKGNTVTHKVPMV